MMSWLQHIELKDPIWLWALLLAPLILYYTRKKLFSSLSYLSIPTVAILPKARTWKSVLFSFLPFLSVLGWSFLVIAMARPQRVLSEEIIKGDGISIFLTIDLSSSMLSQDFNPNRLEASKLVAIDFVQKRKYDKIGIAAFSGEGFTQCPLTSDKDILIKLLEELKCGNLEDGTAIGMGISVAINRLRQDSAKSKVIILLTDGVNNAGDISPQIAAEMAITYNIKIYSIGVGTNGEAYSPIGRNPDGKFVFGMVPVNIDEGLLRDISTRTGGKYYRATTLEQLKVIYNEIDQLEKTKLDIKVFKRYSEIFRPFVLLGLLMLALSYIFRMYLLQFKN